MEKYKLTKKEIKNLDNYWNFIDIFSKPDIKGLSNNWFTFKRTKNKKNTFNAIFGPYNYREYIIPKIRKLYTPEQFYFYEKILNKLLWKLLYKTKFDIKKYYEYIILNNKKIKVKLSYIKCNDKIINKNLNKSKYLYNYGPRSFSHKIYISNYIFLNYLAIRDLKFNYKISMIMRNRKLYEYVINKKNFNINKKFDNKLYKLIDNHIEYSQYYPCDYPFPNVNFIFYNETKKKVWIDRIKKLYYKNQKNKIYDDSGWYDFSCDTVLFKKKNYKKD
jgi:hypothetical protein